MYIFYRLNNLIVNKFIIDNVYNIFVVFYL